MAERIGATAGKEGVLRELDEGKRSEPRNILLVSDLRSTKEADPFARAIWHLIRIRSSLFPAVCYSLINLWLVGLAAAAIKKPSRLYRDCLRRGLAVFFSPTFVSYKAARLTV